MAQSPPDGRSLSVKYCRRQKVQQVVLVFEFTGYLFVLVGLRKRFVPSTVLLELVDQAVDALEELEALGPRSGSL